MALRSSPLSAPSLCLLRIQEEQSSIVATLINMKFDSIARCVCFSFLFLLLLVPTYETLQTEIFTNKGENLREKITSNHFPLFVYAFSLPTSNSKIHRSVSIIFPSPLSSKRSYHDPLPPFFLQFRGSPARFEVQSGSTVRWIIN